MALKQMLFIVPIKQLNLKIKLIIKSQVKVQMIVKIKRIKEKISLSHAQPTTRIVRRKVAFGNTIIGEKHVFTSISAHGVKLTVMLKRSISCSNVNLRPNSNQPLSLKN